VRVFKTRHFSRWAFRERVGDNDLCRAAREAFEGQVDADLGSFLFKKRIRRVGSGKSGAYRAILGFRKANQNRIFFLFGFAKNERSTITAREQTALGADAEVLIALTNDQILVLLERAAILEMECDYE
jgi:hypothetical protein